jgi:hypothetical protein
MKKIPAILAILLVGAGVVECFAQDPFIGRTFSRSGHLWGMEPVGVLPVSMTSGVIPLCDTITGGNTTSGGGVFPKPPGIHVSGLSRFIFVVTITSAPTAGSGQQVNVDLDRSCDLGQTWGWVSEVQADSFTELTGTWYCPSSTMVSYSAPNS